MSGRAPPTRSWKANPAPTPSDGICGTDPTPLAAVALLLAADSVPVQVGAMLYASPGVTFDGNVAGVLRRRIGVVVPVACRYSRLHFARAGYDPAPSALKQAPTLHGSLTGGGYAGVALASSPSPVTGTEVYLDADPALPRTTVAVGVSGTQIDDAPVAQIDRALRTPEGLAPAVEVYQVERAVGACVQFWSRTADLESL